MANLASFLQRQSCCEKLVCTTCGGVLGFLRSMDEYLAGSPPLETQLISLPLQVTQSSRSLGHWLPSLLDKLEPTTAQAVVDHWATTGRDCEAFAASLLSWPTKRVFPAVLAEFVVECLTPRALRDRRLRTELRDRFPRLVAFSPALQEAFRQDREAEIRAAMEAAAAAEAKRHAEQRGRQKLLDALVAELVAMGPADRFRRLLVTPGFRPQELPADLALVTADQLDGLTHAEVEALIRLLGWTPSDRSLDRIPSHGWGALLRLLLELRHVRRARAMHSFRNRRAGLPPVEQLAALLDDVAVPIDMYPVELASQIKSDDLKSLPP